MQGPRRLYRPANHRNGPTTRLRDSVDSSLPTSWPQKWAHDEVVWRHGQDRSRPLSDSWNDLWIYVLYFFVGTQIVCQKNYKAQVSQSYILYLFGCTFSQSLSYTNDPIKSITFCQTFYGNNFSYVALTLMTRESNLPKNYKQAQRRG